MPLATLSDGTRVHCLIRSEARVLDQHVAGYLEHGITIGHDDVVFDVGANVGVFGVRAVQRSPKVRVFAFEPVPAIHAALAQNAARFGEGRLMAVRCGLGREQGRATFTWYPRSPALSTSKPDDWTDPNWFSEAVRGTLRSTPLWYARLVPGFFAKPLASWLQGGAQTVECEIRTVSDVVREHKVDRIDLLKIDCEGAELDVLLGIADEHWLRVRQVVAEVHDVDGRLEAVRQVLTNAGFAHLHVAQEAGFENLPLYNVFATRGPVGAA